MKKRLTLFALLASFVLLSVIAQASAITGRMGNSRMVLNLDVGEEARRSLLIQNVNDVPLIIELAPSGDLATNINFEENSFTLQPGEEKKAYFTIKSDNPGTTETKINVMFKPPQGSGVGLTATVIVVAGGSSANEEASTTDEQAQEQNTGEQTMQNSSPNLTEKSSIFKSNPITLLAVSTIVLVIIFLVLLIYSGKLNKKKRLGRPRD